MPDSDRSRNRAVRKTGRRADDVVVDEANGEGGKPRVCPSHGALACGARAGWCVGRLRWQWSEARAGLFPRGSVLLQLWQVAERGELCQCEAGADGLGSVSR